MRFFSCRNYVLEDIMKKIPVNGYMIVELVNDKRAAFTFGENEYKVVCSENSIFYKPGDHIIIEEALITKIIVRGVETYFVKETDILGMISDES